MDPTSGLAHFKPTAVLFALDARHSCAGFVTTDPAGRVAALAEAWVDDLAGLWRQARAKWGCTILQQALLPVFPALFGGNEHRLPGSGAALVPRLNSLLRDRADTAGADIVALDRQAAQDGVSHWHDPVLWHRAKQEVHPTCAPLYGDLVVRLLAAQQGRSFKCLVLDLDNTLWGGVIGDDGMAGIALGQGSALACLLWAVSHHGAPAPESGSRQHELRHCCSNAPEPWHADGGGGSYPRQMVRNCPARSCGDY